MNVNIVLEIIKDTWFGRKELWRVFWIYKVLLGGAIGFLVQFFEMAGQDFLFVLSFAFYVVFQVWAIKGVYACRMNCTKPELLDVLVKFYVALCAFLLIFTVFNFLYKNVTGENFIKVEAVHAPSSSQGAEGESSGGLKSGVTSSQNI